MRSSKRRPLSVLLAAPRLSDPVFERTVVLIGDQNPTDGSFGWVLNGEELDPVGELLSSANLVPHGIRVPRTISFSKPARSGGPLSPHVGAILYDPRKASFPVETVISNEIALSNHPDALRSAISGDEPRVFHLLLGYASWEAGQLEQEMKEGVWLPAAIDPRLIFQTDPSLLWDVAFQNSTGVSPDQVNFRTWANA